MNKYDAFQATAAMITTKTASVATSSLALGASQPATIDVQALADHANSSSKTQPATASPGTGTVLAETKPTVIDLSMYEAPRVDLSIYERSAPSWAMPEALTSLKSSKPCCDDCGQAEVLRRPKPCGQLQRTPYALPQHRPIIAAVTAPAALSPLALKGSGRDPRLPSRQARLPSIRPLFGGPPPQRQVRDASPWSLGSGGCQRPVPFPREVATCLQQQWDFTLLNWPPIDDQNPGAVLGGNAQNYIPWCGQNILAYAFARDGDAVTRGGFFEDLLLAIQTSCSSVTLATGATGTAWDMLGFHDYGTSSGAERLVTFLLAATRRYETGFAMHYLLAAVLPPCPDAPPVEQDWPYNPVAWWDMPTNVFRREPCVPRREPSPSPLALSPQQLQSHLDPCFPLRTVVQTSLADYQLAAMQLAIQAYYIDGEPCDPADPSPEELEHYFATIDAACATGCTVDEVVAARTIFAVVVTGGCVGGVQQGIADSASLWDALVRANSQNICR